MRPVSSKGLADAAGVSSAGASLARPTAATVSHEAAQSTRAPLIATAPLLLHALTTHLGTTSGPTEKIPVWERQPPSRQRLQPSPSRDARLAADRPHDGFDAAPDAPDPGRRPHQPVLRP